MAQFPEAVFGYRRKSDGKVDSICVKCFRTVGTAQNVFACTHPRLCTAVRRKILATRNSDQRAT